jgi:hypothetical protein
VQRKQTRNTCKTPKKIGRERLAGTGRGETKKEKEEFGIGKRRKSEKKERERLDKKTKAERKNKKTLF